MAQNLRQQIKVAAVNSALTLPIETGTLARQTQQMSEFAKTGFDALDYDIWLQEFLAVQGSMVQMANQKTPSEQKKEQDAQAAKVVAAQVVKLPVT